ncbi:MAG: hypothetical protein ABGX83_03845 [Nitrospira sp.]
MPLENSFSTIILFFTPNVIYAQQGMGEEPQKKQMHKKIIEAVLKGETEKWMALPGVVGTDQGECQGKPCIKVFVVRKTSELLKQIPSKIEGYEVVIQETGEFRALEPN